MNFFVYLFDFLGMILSAYTWVVIASAVVTWVNPDPMNPIVRFLRAVTEPVLLQIRRKIPTSFGGMDIAPMLLIFGILFVQHVILRTLVDLVVGR